MVQWLAVGVLLVLTAQAQALRIATSTGDSVSIYLGLGEPCLVVFPSPVESITTAANQEAVSVELVGEQMYVQLLVAGYETNMFVLLANGQTHYVRLTDAANDGRDVDTRVRLVGGGAPLDRPMAVGPPAPPELSPEAARPSAEGPLRRLLLAMMRGEAVGLRGVALDEVLLEIPGRLRVQALAGYNLGSLFGIEAVARNLSMREPFHLRLPEYRAKGLRAISARDEFLAAGGQTTVWMVFAMDERGHHLPAARLTADQGER